MDLNADQLLADALRDGVRDSIKHRFAQSYNNPLDKWLTAAIEMNATAITGLFGDAIKGLFADAEFRAEVQTATRKTLAKTLVQRFGGELERQVNVLKSDPATRARITLAIEAIVKERVTAPSAT